MTLLFWLSLTLLAYIYVGYPLLVWALATLFGREPARKAITPSVSLLIPAYNEEAHIEAKLRNSLSLDYPKGKLEIFVASDGSTDRTNAIVREFKADGVKLLMMRDNIGKSAMLSRTVPMLRGEIIVFSDASSELEPNALKQIVRNFADRKVGCVSGLYRLRSTSDLRSEGEGLYWRYETFIKRQESRLHSILGAHGAFYAIRQELFTRLGEATINDDYIVPMRIVQQGYRAVYDPSAIAWEREQASVEGEFARRRRIAAGNCQQILELRGMLNPMNGWVALSFFSHKVLRTLAPIFMVCLLITSFAVPSPWGPLLLALQALLYLSASLGYVVLRQGRVVTWLSPPLYFCMGNLAMLAGLLRFCFSRDRFAWDRSR